MQLTCLTYNITIIVIVKIITINNNNNNIYLQAVAGCRCSSHQLAYQLRPLWHEEPWRSPRLGRCGSTPRHREPRGGTWPRILRGVSIKPLEVKGCVHEPPPSRSEYNAECILYYCKYIMLMDVVHTWGCIWGPIAVLAGRNNDMTHIYLPYPKMACSVESSTTRSKSAPSDVIYACFVLAVDDQHCCWLNKLCAWLNKTHHPKRVKIPQDVVSSFFGCTRRADVDPMPSWECLQWPFQAIPI